LYDLLLIKLGLVQILIFNQGIGNAMQVHSVNF